MPVFPIRLIFLIVPVVIAAAILGVGSARGGGFLKKQGVAWVITALMILCAIGIGRAKAPASNIPVPEPGYAVPLPAATVPPNMTPVYAADSYVRDDAGVLSNRTERELDERNERLLERYNVLVGVVTCNYGGDDLGGYAIQRAEEMGLGGYDFIVALDISGENYWLVQGSELVRDFTGDDCSDYAYDYMEDYFARGMYDDAVLALTEALEAWYGNYYG